MEPLQLSHGPEAGTTIVTLLPLADAQREVQSPSLTPVRTVKWILLFLATAVAEIVGCYLPWLWLRRDASAWLLVPAAASLAVFAWLLTLHPTGAGRTFAAYGGGYVASAVVWMWLADGSVPILGIWSVRRCASRAWPSSTSGRAARSTAPLVAPTRFTPRLLRSSSASAHGPARGFASHHSPR